MFQTEQGAASRLSFKAEPQDDVYIQRIIQRAADMAKREGVYIDVVQCWMDIVCVHVNNTPLSLLQFLMSSDYDFRTEFNGITRNMHRPTGELRGYSPMFALKKS